jgi:hypothetical protein
MIALLLTPLVQFLRACRRHWNDARDVRMSESWLVERLRLRDF